MCIRDRSSTLLATEDKPEVKIDWRVVTKDPDNPLIIDVVIEGVSLAKVQKEEFYSIIQSNDGDINSLFANLQNFINKWLVVGDPGLEPGTNTLWVYCSNQLS